MYYVVYVASAYLNNEQISFIFLSICEMVKFYNIFSQKSPKKSIKCQMSGHHLNKSFDINTLFSLSYPY